MEKRLQFRHRHRHRHRHTFAYARTYSTTRASATVQPVMSTCVYRKQRSRLPLRLSSGSQHRHREASPILTQTAQPMIGTERLRTGINDSPAGWSSPFDTVHASTAGIYICSTTIPITIQQDCVSSSEEQSTGSHDS